MSGKYSFSILTEPEEIIEYEKKLYKTYSLEKGWIFKNYEKIGNNRLKPPLDYKDQILYAVKNEQNEIVAGMTVNTDTDNFICEMMGFTIEKHEKSVEGLTMFVDFDIIYLDTREVLPKLAGFIRNHTKECGFKEIYGTTTVKYRKIHRKLFDWEILDEKKINHEHRILLYRAIQ